jgi:16S rRNA (cytosine967-C5)-methyltransferase
MNLEARARLAVELLRIIRRESRPADYVMSTFFKRVRGLEADDKRFVAEATYSALRRDMFFRAAFRAGRAKLRLPSEIENEAVVFLALFAGRSAPRGEIAEAFSRLTGAPVGGVRALARFAEANPDAAFVNGSERRRFAVRHSIPEWVLGELEETRAREELVRLLDALNEEPPLCLRVNSFKTSREDLRERLRTEGVLAKPSKLSPWALVARRDRDVFDVASFREGLFEVQDEGSQIVSLLLGPRPGSRVLDACAGAGGKTLHLGALMKGRGDVYAYDPDARRLANLRRRVRRSGLQNVRVIEADNDLAGFSERNRGALDAVLVDAPCTGLGTLRRSPDIKLRASRELLAEMVRKQEAILNGVADLVKPGGRLVYATCSILPAENVRIVEGFLAGHEDYEPMPVGEALSAQDGGADLALLRERLGGATYMELGPHTHNTDAFFGAVLRRTK